MEIYLEKGGRLERLLCTGGKKAAGNEAEIHGLMERNIGAVFPGMDLVASKKKVDDLVPDTVAFDTERNSFVILEYKNAENKGLVEQGDAYYKLMLDNQKKFVDMYEDAKGKVLGKDDVNWDEARVILVSPSFNKYQLRAGPMYYPRVEMRKISLCGMPIPGYRLVALELVNGVDAQPGGEGKGAAGSKAGGELPGDAATKYTEEEYLAGKYYASGASEQTRQLYYALRDAILDAFPGVQKRQTAWYAGFYTRSGNSAVCTVLVLKSSIKLFYSTTRQDVVQTSQFVAYNENDRRGIGKYTSCIGSEADVAAAIPIVDQVYQSKS